MNIDELLEDNSHGIYFCRKCECNFSGDPNEVYLFPGDLSYLEAGYYYSGSKVLVGEKGLICGHDEPCVVSDDEWLYVECMKLVCPEEGCRVEITFDNEYCSAHSYSDKQSASSAMERHIRDDHKKVISGDLYVSGFARVLRDNPQGAGWAQGDIIRITSIDGHNIRGKRVLTASHEKVGHERTYYCLNTDLDGCPDPGDDELYAKFRPKTGEKKVTVLD